MRRTRLLAAAALLALGALTVASAGLGAERRAGATAADVRYPTAAELAVPLLDDQAGPVKGSQARGLPAGQAASTLRSARKPKPKPKLGEVRNWLALDDVAGGYYRRKFALRGLGEHVEVWVASGRRTVLGVTADGTDFPDGDCRNGVRTEITDAHVQALVREFDATIHPRESAAFSTLRERDGSEALLGRPFEPAGEGDVVVVLVDNVRDENFYDTNNAGGASYIAGFFSPSISAYLDRNVVTVDAFDWLHRTGASPPHEPVPGDTCASAPARPFLYEGVLAHEYQHLLHHDEDPAEATWVDEGLSDWAQTLTGYSDPARPVTEIGFDSHVQCFLGWLGTQTAANPNPRAGGPENSLTAWGDQGDGELLCDYGAAYTLTEYLHGRFGTPFLTALHRLDSTGLAGLQEALDARPAGRGGDDDDDDGDDDDGGGDRDDPERRLSAQDVLHQWQLMLALDARVDRGALVSGLNASLLRAPTLDASVNWDSPHAYDSPGAPPNGADYVRLRDAAGRPLRGARLSTIAFAGATTLPSEPVRWTVDPRPPFRAGDPALSSGSGNDRDVAVVRRVTVPAGAAAALTFEALWNLEAGWDFGFVQVSTDGGATYESLACTGTTAAADPAGGPAFTGYSDGWTSQACSLAAHAGRTVLLAFRALNDGSNEGESPDVAPGFWIDAVAVGGTPVSDGATLDGWQSPTQVRPLPVGGFTVYLVSIREDRRRDRVTVTRLELGRDLAAGTRPIHRYVDRRADFVGAVVIHDDPGETTAQYAPYRLTVNGVVQPGGGMERR